VSTNHTCYRKTTIARMAVVATITGTAALTFAGPASAYTWQTVLNQDIGASQCPVAEHFLCGKKVVLHFGVPEHGGIPNNVLWEATPSVCDLEGNVDGQSVGQGSTYLTLAAGAHTITLDCRGHGTDVHEWRSALKVSALVSEAADTAPAPNQKPAQAPEPAPPPLCVFDPFNLSQHC
jgi:hypothetical protein